jgi:uncharacterized glyoxalase superfamily protein PhnB
MNETVQPIPEGFHSLTPHLVVKGADEALDFYVNAFGGVVETVLRSPDGQVMHAAMRIGDSELLLNDEFPQWGVVGPETLEGTPVTIHLYCADVNAAWERARKAGCRIGMELQNTFWGDRYGMLLDPFGHHWALAQRIENLTQEQISEASRRATRGEPGPDGTQG